MQRSNSINMLNDESVHFSNYIYPKAVSPIIEAIRKKVDDEFKKQARFSLYMEEKEYERELSRVYEEKREWLKQIYFCENRFSMPEKPLLDMHKIAAVICRSMIKMKPFAFDIEKANDYILNANKQEDLDWLINNYLVNYKVAFDSALMLNLYDLINRLSYMDLSDKSLLDNPKDIREKFLKYLAKKGFYYYKEVPLNIPYSHEKFYKSSIINLAINDINKRDFDYLGFATNCFQIQQNTIFEFLQSYS